MIPKGLIDTVREWVNQRLNKEVFKVAKKVLQDVDLMQKENSNPNMGTVQQVAVCKDW
jgi:hypothetical protein